MPSPQDSFLQTVKRFKLIIRAMFYADPETMMDHRFAAHILAASLAGELSSAGFTPEQRSRMYDDIEKAVISNTLVLPSKYLN